LLLARIRDIRIAAAILLAGMALEGCTGGAELVLLPFKIAAEIIAADDDSSSNSYGPAKIAGYCHDRSKNYVYTLYGDAKSSSCQKGDVNIDRATFERIFADNRRAYCVDGERLYHADATTCDTGHSSLTKAEWEALSRNHSTPAVL
jgi:hypothetical protein